MAGAGVSVVVNRPIDTTDLVAHFEAIGAKYRETADPPGWFEIAVTATTRIGGNYSGEERLFDIRRGADPAYDDAFEKNRMNKIYETFGLRPASTIYITAHRNKPDDQRVLGELALYFARAYGGLIDFDGALIPRSTLSAEERANPTRIFDANWDDIAAARERFFATVRGKIVSVPYETGNGRTWVTHVADADFMGAWLAHPDFHMIK